MYTCTRLECTEIGSRPRNHVLQGFKLQRAEEVSSLIELLHYRSIIRIWPVGSPLESFNLKKWVEPPVHQSMLAFGGGKQIRLMMPCEIVSEGCSEIYVGKQCMLYKQAVDTVAPYTSKSFIGTFLGGARSFTIGACIMAGTEKGEHCKFKHFQCWRKNTLQYGKCLKTLVSLSDTGTLSAPKEILYPCPRRSLSSALVIFLGRCGKMSPVSTLLSHHHFVRDDFPCLWINIKCSDSRGAPLCL